MLHAMWDSILYIIQFILVFLFLLLGLILTIVLYNVVRKRILPPLQRLRDRLRPRCRACREGRMLGYNLGFSDAREYQYYRCNLCESHFKRSIRGRWTPLPRGAASKREREALFERRTSLISAQKRTNLRIRWAPGLEASRSVCRGRSGRSMKACRCCLSVSFGVRRSRRCLRR